MRSAFTGLALLCVAAASGCQTASIPPEEISKRPIAFVYLQEAAARRRAEALTDEPEEEDPRSAIENRGVVNVNDVREYLDQRFGGQARQSREEGVLALLDARTGELSVVEQATKGAVPHAWSADGRRLLFTQRTSSGTQVYELDTRAGTVARMTTGPESHFQPCYGPGGRLAVVVQRVETREAQPDERFWAFRVGLLTPSGSIELISDGPHDATPTCAPDGAAIAYVKVDSSNRATIWVRSFAGDGDHRLIAPGRDPSFAPDGQWIVYSHETGGNPTLWRIRKDGTGRTRLGVGSGAEEYGPAVSPDGSLVVYESVLDNRFRLFVRRFDGTGDTVLFADGDGTNAVW